jgi:hypothetical protein
MEGGAVYFEQQGLFSMQCGRHSVNHLLGGPLFSREAMNQICYGLSQDLINPHKHLFGGDYDLNVLMLALQTHGLLTRWHDKRSGPLAVPRHADAPEVVGFLVNVHASSSLSFLMRVCGLSRRHWFAVRRVGGRYYWLDSKEAGGVVRGGGETEEELNRLLRTPAESPEEQAEVLVVMRE